MRLTISDLRDVRRLLYRVRRQWYNIGIELGLEIGDLDTIKSAYKDPGDALIEMLKVWLKSTKPLPTWKALGDALKEETVNEEALADKGNVCVWKGSSERFLCTVMVNPY